jgi:hypothetical protein
VRRARGVLGKVAVRVAHRQRSGLTMLSQSRPGVRLVDGEPYYSADWLDLPADWLDRPPSAALPRVRGDAD